jgi:hypothetical protein
MGRLGVTATGDCRVSSAGMLPSTLPQAERPSNISLDALLTRAQEQRPAAWLARIVDSRRCRRMCRGG